MSLREKIRRNIRNFAYANQELLWARVWDDTSKDIDWVKKIPGITPGRWAVGYNYIYLITRVLEETNPHYILDLGLGISSTIISTYLKEKEIKIGKHLIVEHDKDWFDFYSKRINFSSISKVQLADVKKLEVNSNWCDGYKDFSSIVLGDRYDLISIDGPVGGDKISRRDILDIIPDVLSENFVIIIDDAERCGELNTISEIESILKENNIDYRKGVYSSVKNCCIITSAKNKFLCTM